MGRRRKYGLVLTGCRRRRHYLVLVQGLEVWLTRGTFVDLCRLVGACGTDSEYLRLSPVAVRRLRAAIDESLGDGAGMGIVETGDGAEYRLTLARRMIARDKSFHLLKCVGDGKGFRSLPEIAVKPL